MTHHPDSGPLTADAPSPERERSESSTGAPGVGRLIGLDLARGLAVFGMYAVHVGPAPSQGGVIGFMMELAQGRSSTLFAVLAGFAVALITGRRTPKTGLAGRQAVAKVIIRAVVLIALGTALTMTGTPVVPILAFYGLFFLLVLPLYRLGAKPLALVAAGWALVGPQLLYALKPVVGGRVFLSYGQADGPVSLFFTGGYPALTWVPFVIAGMALARCDLAATSVRIRLALTGVALAVTGYGGSWLAVRLVPGAAEAVRKAEEGPGMSSVSSVSPDSIGIFGDTPAGMLASAPQSEATLSIMAATGVAILVITACLAAMGAFPRLRRLAKPVIAVGSMSLTAYVYHIVAIWLLDTEQSAVPPLHILLGLIASVAVLATTWSRFFQRGRSSG
ncbi:putative membrane protein YeiB [Streptomyces sp. B4I13]|nr:heparan-alpha-glucosaminide N-acetyltransferase domain-containing protein [Streptomyces sp. B4I13]MDQ0962114.1 putative membrane protein YeiB [Streptomyces sp. B4I13]